MCKSIESTIEFNEDFNEYTITIPEEILDNLGWEDGDVVEWIDNKNGSLTLVRVNQFEEENDGQED